MFFLKCKTSLVVALEMLTSDVIIIGAGPVGLFAVFQAGMLGMKSTVIDALDVVGGQCSALYPQKPIYDIPGFKKINGSMLIENLAEQAAPFSPTYILGQQVNELNFMNGKWQVTTNCQTIIEAKIVIIAAGVGAFMPNKPPLEGIEKFEGNSVLYNVEGVDKFKEKKVVIAGGGDSALDWAIELSKITSKVYLVHRRDKFRAMESSIKTMRSLVGEGKIELMVPYQLHGILEEGGQLSKVVIQDLDGNKKELAADYLLPFFGMAMKIGPIKQWGMNLDKDRIVVNPETMETSLPGVFAIGDISCYNGKLKLILTGFSEAALACHTAYNIVYPDKALHFEYSTTKGINNL